MHNEKILVAGAGAIGSLFGGLLSRSGYNVTLIDSWMEHVRKIDQEGLELSAPDSHTRIRIRALNPESLMHIDEKPNIVLLAVKSYDTRTMLEMVRPLLVSDNTLIVSCQNGVNEETIAASAGRAATLGCVISFGAVLEGPGHVRQLNSEGRLIIGQYDGGTSKTVKLKQIFSSITHTEVTGNLMGHRWSKLALNCMSNPLLALTGYTAQELYEEPRARKVMIKLVAELVRAGEACGVVLEPIVELNPELWKKAEHNPVPDVEHALDVMGKKLGGSRSSMVHDLNTSRPTEIEFLNGYVASKAGENGMEASCNEAVTDLIHKLSRGEMEPGPDLLDLLMDCSTMGSIA
jgi:2-dehydropantoate 2-reductase